MKKKEKNLWYPPPLYPSTEQTVEGYAEQIDRGNQNTTIEMK